MVDFGAMVISLEASTGVMSEPSAKPQSFLHNGSLGLSENGISYPYTHTVRLEQNRGL